MHVNNIDRGAIYYSLHLTGSQVHATCTGCQQSPLHLSHIVQGSIMRRSKVVAARDQYRW